MSNHVQFVRTHHRGFVLITYYGIEYHNFNQIDNQHLVWLLIIATLKKIMPSSNPNINKKNMGGWFTKVIAVPTKSGDEVVNSSRTQDKDNQHRNNDQDAQAVG